MKTTVVEFSLYLKNEANPFHPAMPENLCMTYVHERIAIQIGFENQYPNRNRYNNNGFHPLIKYELQAACVFIKYQANTWLQNETSAYSH